MTAAQVAANAAATRWLADRLETAGWVGDAHHEAAHVIRELLAMGLAPIPRPDVVPPPATSTAQGRAAARRLFEETRRGATRHRTDNEETR